MSSLYDRVMMTVSGTPGAGTITLGAAVLDGSNGDRLTFAQGGVPNGATVSYVVVDGHNWGKGRGVYTTSGTTLSRDAAETTWNGSTVGNTPISLTSNAVVFLAPLALDLNEDGANVNTQEGTTSSSYTDLATVGPSVTLVTGSSAFIDISSQVFNNSTGNNGYISVAVSGATTLAASDSNGVTVSQYTGGGFSICMCRRFKLTGLTPGSNTFTMKYRCNGSTWNFSNRSLLVKSST